jgi:UDP-galactopyranose mutase
VSAETLVVGAGFAGSVCAERLASAGQRVRIIDERPHIGGTPMTSATRAGFSSIAMVRTSFSPIPSRFSNI